MRSIPILAVMLALAVYQFTGNGTACAATAGGSQPVQTSSQADCRGAALTNGTADRLAHSACHTASGTSRLVQRRPGFWIAEDVGPGTGGNAADPPPAVLRAADTPPPAGAAACVSYPLPVVVGGQSLQATVVACPRPDGSWQATQYTPGLPPQVYTVPPPPAAGASPNDYASPAIIKTGPRIGLAARGFGGLPRRSSWCKDSISSMGSTMAMRTVSATDLRTASPMAPAAGMAASAACTADTEGPARFPSCPATSRGCPVRQIQL